MTISPQQRDMTTREKLVALARIGITFYCFGGMLYCDDNGQEKGMEGMLPEAVDKEWEQPEIQKRLKQ